MPPVALTIAASDPLGGAGIQADLATFAALGVHGTSALTAVTAQSLRSVTAVELVSPELVASQIDSITAELAVTGAKTGMLRSPEVVSLVASRVAAGDLPAPVVDPVMVDGRGRRFVSEETEAAYRDLLFPVARVLTPNRAEAELLTQTSLPGPEEVLVHAERFRSLGSAAVVVTGGAFEGEPHDVVITADGNDWGIEGQRIGTSNVRGSGCTFSAAIAAGLASGTGLSEAIKQAHNLVSRSITAAMAWRFGGAGPVSHIIA